MANGPLSLRNFQQGRVVMPGQAEAIKWTVYDFQLYPLAGVQQLNFFQLPIGQGITSAPGAVVGTAKTLQDTNMQQQGMFPRYMDFLVDLIEVYFFAGSSNVANTFVADPVASVHADPIVIADVSGLNDIVTIRTSGLLTMSATDKDYIREAPLIRFPPTTHLGFSAALTAVAGSVGEVAYGDAFGKPYIIRPELTLTANQNFNVQISWPAAIATPSTFNGRIGVVLSGSLKRPAQ